MKKEERETLSDTLLEASRQMLADQGRPLDVAGEDVPHSEISGAIIASIGLSGPRGLRGALVLVGLPACFRSLYPAELTADPRSDAMADWASEMANQLLGRIKNLLSRHGTDFSMGIPTLVRGDRLSVIGWDRPSSVSHSFRVGAHSLDVCLEMERVGSETLFDTEGEVVETSPEGTALLF